MLLSDKEHGDGLRRSLADLNDRIAKAKDAGITVQMIVKTVADHDEYEIKVVRTVIL